LGFGDKHDGVLTVDVGELLRLVQRTQQEVVEHEGVEATVEALRKGAFGPTFNGTHQRGIAAS